MINKNLACVILIGALFGCSSNQKIEKEPEKEELINDPVVVAIPLEEEKEELKEADYIDVLSSELLRGSDIFNLTEDSVLVNVMVTAMNESVLSGSIVPIDKQPIQDSFTLYCKNISTYSKGIMEKHQSGHNVISDYNKMAKGYKVGMKQIIDSDLPEETKIDRMELETSRIKIMHFLTKMASYAPEYKKVEDKKDASIFFENVIYKSCLQKKEIG